VGFATSKNQACDLNIGSSMIGMDSAAVDDSRCLPFLFRVAGESGPEPNWLSCTNCEGKENKSRLDLLRGGFLCRWRVRQFLPTFFLARSSWLRTNVKEVELVRNWFVDCLSPKSIAAPEWFCGERRAIESGK
jgi:hypothetical protein